MSTQTDLNGFWDLQALQEAMIPLEPEHFDRAVELSRTAFNEHHQWQAYIQELACGGFLTWLAERTTSLAIAPPTQTSVPSRDLPSAGIKHLVVNGFTLCLLVTESVAHETVMIPGATIATVELAAHLYVLLEVQEEREQVILRGCLWFDQLLDRLMQSVQPDEIYGLPLDWFDPDPNHLLFYLQFLQPAVAIVPASAQPVLQPTIAALHQTLINVWNWSQNLVDVTTQAFSWSMPQPLTPAFALRRSPSKVEAAFQDLVQRQQLKVPPQAQYSYITLEGTPFQIGAVSWLLAENRSQLDWALLLIVVAQPGKVLPLGTTLQVMATTGLAEVTLETTELYLYILVEGAQDETFTPTIRSPHIAPVILPAFVCRPPS
jgi:hypothetical protein